MRPRRARRIARLYGGAALCVSSPISILSCTRFLFSSIGDIPFLGTVRYQICGVFYTQKSSTGILFSHNCGMNARARFTPQLAAMLGYAYYFSLSKKIQLITFDYIFLLGVFVGWIASVIYDIATQNNKNDD